jgi:ribosome-binding factor A
MQNQIVSVNGTDVASDHAKYFDEPDALWSPRDSKLQKRVDRLQRKKKMRDKFAYANTANRDDGGADLSIPINNDVFYSRSSRNTRLDSSWADSVRQLRVGTSVQHALAQVLDADYKEHAPHAHLFRTQLAFEAVRMTRDTRVARIYFSTVTDTPDMRKLVFKALVEAMPAIRMLLVRRVSFKYAPQLIVMRDEYNREQRLTELAMERIYAEQRQQQNETAAAAAAVGVESHERS